VIFHQAIRYEERIPAVRPAACSGDLGLVSEKKSSKGFANSKKEARRGIRVDAFFEARIRRRDQRISRFEQDGFALKATSDWILPVGHIHTPAGVFKTCPVPFTVNALLPKMGLPVFSGNPSTQTSIPIRRESAFQPLSSRNFGLFASTSQFVVFPGLSVTSMKTSMWGFLH